MSTTEATGQRGAGGGRGRGGRNGGRHSGGAARGHQPARPRTSAFRGSTSEMNGNVFQCSEEQNNRMQFKNTKDALQEYVKKHLKHAEDLAPLFALTMATPKLTMPTEPGTNPSRTEEMIYTEKVKQFVKRETTLEGNLATIHAVAWGQCSEAMKARVKSFDHYQSKTDANDCLWLLESIRATTLELDEKKMVSCRCLTQDATYSLPTNTRAICQ
jgi:hypothetical protein